MGKNLENYTVKFTDEPDVEPPPLEELLNSYTDEITSLEQYIQQNHLNPAIEEIRRTSTLRYPQWLPYILIYLRENYLSYSKRKILIYLVRHGTDLIYADDDLIVFRNRIAKVISENMSKGYFVKVNNTTISSYTGHNAEKFNIHYLEEDYAKLERIFFGFYKSDMCLIAILKSLSSSKSWIPRGFVIESGNLYNNIINNYLSSVRIKVTPPSTEFKFS